MVCFVETQSVLTMVGFVRSRLLHCFGIGLLLVFNASAYSQVK